MMTTTKTTMTMMTMTEIITIDPSRVVSGN
jgi:hypothetical protein